MKFATVTSRHISLHGVRCRCRSRSWEFAQTYRITKCAGQTVLAVLAARFRSNTFGARTMTIDPQSERVFLVTAEFTLNPNAPQSDPQHPYSVTQGTVRLLFLDPADAPR
jgi:hypothetical protein